MGGAQQSLVELCTTLPTFGVEAGAAVPPGPLYDTLQAAGVSVYPVSAIRAKRHGLGLIATLFKLTYSQWTLASVINGFQPDIIHANTIPASLAVGKAPFGTFLFSHIRDLRQPVLAVQQVVKNSTRIIAISTALDTYLGEIINPRHLGRIRTIRNGIDTARFTPGDKTAARRRFALPEDAPVIGMVAHLIPWKQHNIFLAAAKRVKARHPAAHFVIVGRDLFSEHTAWMDRLRAYAKSNGLQDAVHWIHDLDRTEQIYPAFDILVHPARNEPFGRVVCEAMAMRIPVIAARSGGITDIITDGANGMFVPEGDTDATAASVCALLTDPGRANALAEAGRQHILAHFTKEHLARQLAHEYASAIAAETRKRGEE